MQIVPPVLHDASESMNHVGIAGPVECLGRSAAQLYGVLFVPHDANERLNRVVIGGREECLCRALTRPRRETFILHLNDRLRCVILCKFTKRGRLDALLRIRIQQCDRWIVEGQRAEVPLAREIVVLTDHTAWTDRPPRRGRRGRGLGAGGARAPAGATERMPAGGIGEQEEQDLRHAARGEGGGPGERRAARAQDATRPLAWSTT
mmetsp:Transcript_66311/g.202958  ORF Transcript_66311/g.202958 Transcript_66311/m.202958 type:complete len:206 (+) Transcript_66311:734-1351(+)